MKNKKVKWKLNASGDGLWGLDYGDKVEVYKIKTYTNGHEDQEIFMMAYYKKIKGNPNALPYTDSAILKQIQSKIRNKNISWTEQGMQGENYMHLIIDGVW